ncbi:hypothetical protein [uncultured Cocleimonas sp.]|uniref:hypothetical protein n=1 Tax=uncultured Cocleimonas sp. TaxID=1051587 RepID=UPI002639342A|nr:hypothetical protein [uncultured Cocleimonas sp.]
MPNKPVHPTNEGKRTQGKQKALPDQFLYARKGPWPQPSPSHPLLCADEVLNIPPIETLMFNATIGERYLTARVAFPPVAAMYAVSVEKWAGPDDVRFNKIMFDSVYTRFLKPLVENEHKELIKHVSDCGNYEKLWKYDFTAMDKVEPIDNTYCAATVLYLGEKSDGSRESICIKVNQVYILPKDPAWMIGKIYVLQGAAYHVLFVVHPSLHFPMDAVNAITKSSVAIAHPLFQALHPHTAYSLALDNAVLESAESVVNNNAQGTRFDPLTGNAYNLKLLFGAGYTGLSDEQYTNGYPAFNYMKPSMYYSDPAMAEYSFDSDYGRWLADYYNSAFLPFAQKIADHILKDNSLTDYRTRWARYNHTHVLGFPSEHEIHDRDVFAAAIAVFMWDTSVSHGGDHYSFAYDVEVVEKCLRIRIPPPQSSQDSPTIEGNLFTGDDMARASICQNMFFEPSVIKPSLAETLYAFTSAELQLAVKQFHIDLRNVDKTAGCKLMPLIARNKEECGENAPCVSYKNTIPQSIQY